MTTFAVLGPGGIGGLIGGALSHGGHEVTVIPRPDTASTHPHELFVESVTLGKFRAPVHVTAHLSKRVDVLWVTVKAYQLASALASVDPGAVEGGMVVALMNGIDHMAVLRASFPDALVVTGSIRTESTRVAPGHIVHGGWHVVDGAPSGPLDMPAPTRPIQLASSPLAPGRVEALARELEESGVPTQVWSDEKYLLWTKLAILCPYALATTAARGPIGAVRTDPELRKLLQGCAEEIAAVAAALGTRLDEERLSETLAGFPDAMRVSMERDAAAGRPIEVVAVTDPVLREGRAHGIPVTATEELRRRAIAAAPASIPAEDRISSEPSTVSSSSGEG
jgi:2-dehydropantoate 2-reductase